MNLSSNQKTGVVHGMPEFVYRADPALSTSDLKLIGNPWEFVNKVKGLLPNFDTTSMATGRLFHMYVLEKDRWDKEVRVCPDEFSDKRRKESKEWWAKADQAGVTVLKEAELMAVQNMHDSYKALPVVKGIKTIHTEVSAFAKKMAGKVDCKCRIDLVSGTTVIDIKTTRKGGANPWEFQKTSRRLKYHWQEANYRRIAKAAGLDIGEWYWAVVETEPPYSAAIYQFSKQDMVMANAELDEAYRKLQACLELNNWPSYTPSEPMTLNLFRM